MINSRNLHHLHSVVRIKAEEHIWRCKDNQIDLLVTSTWRDDESQLELYKRGREQLADGSWKVVNKKLIVTNARPGQSYHNWKVAYDVVPIKYGKAVWDDMATWQLIGKIGKKCGLEWAGDWDSFKEMPHFQYTGGLSPQELREGKVPR